MKNLMKIRENNKKWIWVLVFQKLPILKLDNPRHSCVKKVKINAEVILSYIFLSHIHSLPILPNCNNCKYQIIDKGHKRF